MNLRNNKYLNAFKPSRNPSETKTKWKLRFRVIIAIFLLYAAFDLLRLGYVVVTEGTVASNIPLSEFNNLFTKETRYKLRSPLVYKSKVKEAESSYYFDNDFRLIVYKLNLVADKPLGQILYLQNKHSYNSFDGFDLTLAEGTQLELTRASGKINGISLVNFKYQGDLKTISKNDSLICYFLKANNFSISYNNKSGYDILGNPKDSKDVAISLAFIKKKKSVYVIMLFKTKDENQDFPPGMLYNIIKK